MSARVVFALLLTVACAAGSVCGQEAGASATMRKMLEACAVETERAGGGESANLAQMRDAPFEGGPGVALVARPPFAALANDKIGLVFRCSGRTAGLTAVYHAAKGTQFLRMAPGARPLWEAAFMRKAEFLDTVNSTHPAQVALKTSVGPDRATIRIEWCFARPAMTADLAVSVASGDSLSRWTLDVAGGEADKGIGEVEFPILRGLGPPAAGACDFLALPVKAGWLYLNPGKNAAYDGEVAMQFMCYYTEAGAGLYVSPHDGLGRVKSVTALGDSGSTALSFVYPVEDMGAPRKAHAFTAAIGVFDGGWYEGSQMYKAWARQQRWAPKAPLHARRDVPQWLKENCLTIRGDIARREDMERQARMAEEMRDFFDMPILCNWYQWFEAGNCCAWAPEWAPRGYAGIRSMFEQQKARGIHPAVYSLVMLWDTRLESWKTQAFGHRVLSPQGSIFWGRYNDQPLAYVCPASRGYAEALGANVEAFTRDYGVDGTYADLAGTHVAEECFNPEHGHPLGGGSYHWDGHRQMLHVLRDKARLHNPDFVTLVEFPDERILDAFDGYLLYQGFQPGTSRNIPLFQAVYGEYVRAYGAKAAGVQDSPLEAVTLVQLLAWGNAIGRVFMPDGAALADAFKKGHEPHRRLARLRRAHLPYLGWGTMLRPPALSYKGKAPLGFHPAMDFSVEAAAWQAPDGSVALVLGNTRVSQPVTVEFSADPAAYGVAADGAWSWSESDETGQRKKRGPAASKAVFVEELRGLESRVLILDRER